MNLRYVALTTSSILALAFACERINTDRNDSAAGGARIELAQQDERLDDVERRLSGIESRLAALEETVKKHGEVVHTISLLPARISTLEATVENLAKNGATKAELQGQVTSMLEGVNRDLNDLRARLRVVDEANLELGTKIQTLETWQTATQQYLDTLKTSDITSAVADLQTWKAAIAGPLQDILTWRVEAEGRLAKVEEARDDFRTCLSVLDVNATVGTNPNANASEQVCRSLRGRIDALQGIFPLADALRADLDALAAQLATASTDLTALRGQLERVSDSLIRSTFQGMRAAQPCGSVSGVTIRLSANEAYTDELVHKRGEANARNGHLSSGVYDVKNGPQILCSFTVAFGPRAVADDVRRALSLPNNLLGLRSVAWTYAGKHTDTTVLTTEVRNAN